MKTQQFLYDTPHAIKPTVIPKRLGTGSPLGTGIRKHMLIRAACAMLFVLICSPPSLLAQTELIANGGFESGVSGWTPSGSIGSPVSSLYGFARSGSYYLWLGGTLNLSEITYQSVTIPASVTSATLSFYYNINSLEGNSAAYDKFSVTVRNASGVLLATVGEWSNMNQDPSGGNPYYHQKTFDLLPFAGSTILIYFSSVNDSTLVTNFRVDDVSVRVTTAQCLYAISPVSATVVAGGGSQSFGVTAGGGCSWTASTSQSWIHTTSSGTGSGTVAYTVDANSTTTLRTGSITIGGQTFTISQTGATCAYALSSSGVSLPASGGSGNFGLNTVGGCAWTAAASQTWIHTTSSGTGSGTVAYSVDANPATATRAGTIAVGGQQFSISQAGVSSQTDFPSAVWIPAGSGHFTSSARGSADVTSIVIHTTEDSYYGATISWFQNTSDPTANTSSHYLVQRDGSVVQFVREKDIAHHAGVWLWNQHSVGIEVERLANATETITSFQYASVKSLVESIRTRFSVPLLLPASTPLSSPTLVVDGIVGHGKAVYYGTDPVNWSWTLFQQLLNPSCTYSVNPPSTTLPASGGSGNIGVTTVGGCAWTAAASQTWIHTTSSGIGSGTVAYTVDANSTTSARAGSITVGGQTFTISQTGATCTYALSSSGTSLPASGGSGNIVVNTAGGCAWTAAASQTWIHTTSSGTGSGTVAYTVDANATTSLRTGTITVGGQTFTLSQAGATCTYVLSSSGTSLSASGGSGNFGLNTVGGCAWTAAASQPWIHTTSSGTGSGTVAYTVDANSTTTLRTGSITIGGQIFTISQAGATCTYALSSSGTSLPASGGSGNIGVTTVGGCAWTAAASQTWIHTTSSGTGSGTVAYTVDANATTSLRTGTITVGVQTFTISQAGATCTYALSSSGTSLPASGGSGNIGVTTVGGCAWTAAASQPWIHTTSSGTGSGTVAYTVDGNATTSLRTGTITVGGQAFTITQAGTVSEPAITNPSPGSTLASSSVMFQWSSGTGVDEYFLYIGTSIGTNDLYGQSQGLNLSVSINSLPVNGSTLYVRLYWRIAGNWYATDYIYPTESAADGNDQISESIYIGTPNKTTQLMMDYGDIDNGLDVDMFSFDVTAGQKITFDVDGRNASNLDSYLRLFNASGTQLGYSDDDPAPGESSSTESYLEYTFTSSGRYYVGVSGFSNIAYDPVTGYGDASGVTGEYSLILTDVTTAQCSYVLSPVSAVVGADPGSQSFGVAAGAGCPWAASTGQSWIHTTSSGTGSGTVAYTVDANSTTSVRAGSITVGGQVFEISQAARGGLSVILFSDNFGNSQINTNQWATSGNKVEQVNGTMRVGTDAVDNGGFLLSKPFPMAPSGKVTITRNVNVHQANAFFAGNISVRYGNLPWMAVHYADHSYNGGGAHDRHGTFISRTAGAPEGAWVNLVYESNPDNIVGPFPMLWNSWFAETITYAPETGQLEYLVNNVKLCDYNIGLLPPSNTPTIQFGFSAWGWWTGHEQLFDDLVVSQTQLTPPLLQLVDGSVSSAGFKCVLKGPAGSSCVVSASSDLRSWTGISTNTIPAGGWAAFVDPSATNAAKRFYRVSKP